MGAFLLFSLPLTVMASDFKPFMADHPFEGCPANSICREETGKLRLDWFSLLKGHSKKKLGGFAKRRGIPVGVWTRRKDHERADLAVWDSPCPGHRKKGLEIYDGELFVKNFRRSLEEDSSLIGRRAIGLVEGQRMDYIIPRDGVPLLMKGGKLYFMREMRGFYYTISVSPSGAVSLEDSFTPKHLPEDTDCPDELQGALTEWKKNPHLYSGETCRNIWHTEKKAFVPFVYGWSCS